MRMSKETLESEITKELEKLNDAIDRKIIKGKPYQAEARRHKELSATLKRIRSEHAHTGPEEYAPARRAVRRGKSPVHKRLTGGVFRRVFSFGFAM